jgi:hypothetical protein
MVHISKDTLCSSINIAHLIPGQQVCILGQRASSLCGWLMVTMKILGLQNISYQTISYKIQRGVNKYSPKVNQVANSRPIESLAKSTSEPNGYPVRRWCMPDMTEHR